MSNKFLIAALFCFVSGSALASEITGRVVAVLDGDTIKVLDSSNTQYRIRLSGVDAPEKKQAYGQVSKQSLSDMVYNKAVRVEWSKNDRYGRYVGKVIENGHDVNLEQVHRGMAWFYRKYQNELPLDDRLLYLAAETEAKAHGWGLWNDNNPTPPWEFRRGQ